MEFKRAGGVLAHPVSFPSPYGIGDLGQSAFDFIDFLKKAKQSIWQVLPLGPTSFGDSPYQSFSTFAGNPLLISPELLLEQGLLTRDDLAAPPEGDPHSIDYGAVVKYKNALFEKAFKNLKTKTAFNKFCKANADWLEDFALFAALKDYFIKERANTFKSPEYMAFKKLCKKKLSENQSADYYYGAVWLTWPEDIKNHEPEAVESWSKKLKNQRDFHKFLQFEFFRQWGLLKDYANKSGIQIIGDIPIFVALDSSDVWSAGNLFLLDKKGFPAVVAGVPPDYFSATGQLWGNPLYNWAEHKKEGFAWWLKRIKRTLSFVDILRIDHFRGFSAYWAVPFGEETAVNGSWCEAPGEELFSVIENEFGDIPIIAEDLGIITKEVEELRDRFRLPGMKVIQFGFNTTDISEHLPHNFKTNNLAVYTGTHDNDTTVGWYRASDSVAQDYFRRYLNVPGDDPAWDMIRLCYSSTANIAVAPLQDLMALDSAHRMNTPGVPAGNWKFRYTAEMLAPELADRLAYLTELYNRVTVE